MIYLEEWIIYSFFNFLFLKDLQTRLLHIEMLLKESIDYMVNNDEKDRMRSDCQILVSCRNGEKNAGHHQEEDYSADQINPQVYIKY